MNLGTIYSNNLGYVVHNGEMNDRAFADYAIRMDCKEIQNFNIQKILTHLANDLQGAFGELNLLCDKYGSDKGSNYDVCDGMLHGYPWYPHTYTNVYEMLFKHLKYKKINLFECGIGTNNPQIKSNMTINGHPGASLRVWQDYFPYANIYGADIDRKSLFKEDRIKTYWIDQTSPTAIKRYFNRLKVPFDIIIDDGLHTVEAAYTLLDSAFTYLCKGGIYVIEDLTIDQIQELHDLISTKENMTVQYVLMHTPIQTDNNMIICHKLCNDSVL